MGKGARFSLEGRTIRLHPKLWEWAEEDGLTEGYERGAAGLIGALILYNRAIKRRHWLTVDILNDPQKLERALAEIESHNPLEKSGTWIEHRLEEMFGKPIRKENP